MKHPCEADFFSCPETQKNIFIFLIRENLQKKGKQMKKHLFAKSTLLLTSLSIFCAPLQAQQASFPQPYQENGGSIWSNNSGFIGGTLFGAAVGALTAAAVTSSKRGSPGVPGRPGRDGMNGANGAPFTFPRDAVGTSITVDPQILIEISPLSTSTILPTSLTVTPFITFPNQTTIVGSPTNVPIQPTPPPAMFFPIAGHLTVLTPFTINQPYFGNYEIGVRIDINTTQIVDLELMIAFITYVSASRDSSKVALTEIIPYIAAADLNRTGVTQAQVSMPFTYDATIIP